MQKIAINISQKFDSYFGFSEVALEYLTKYSDKDEINRCTPLGIHPDYRVDSYFRKYRSHPLLIQMIEELGSEEVSAYDSNIQIVEIPSDVEWVIHNDEDGYEWVSEKTRTWFYKEEEN